MEIRKVYIDAIAYQLGELRDIGDIEALKSDAELLAGFKAHGLSKYSVSGLDPIEQARRCFQSTLERSDVPREEIDIVLYATDHLTGDPTFDQDVMLSLANELGLTKAYPIGVSLGGCANGGSALTVASSLVATRAASSVLVVIIDKLEPELPRVMDLGLSVLSDGAVSCLVQSDPGRFELVSTAFCSRPQIQDISVADAPQEFFQATGAGVHQVVSEALAPLKASPGDLSRVITNNYVTHVLESILSACGFSSEQCFFDNIGRFAHAFSADNLINLSDLSDEGGLRSGEVALMLGTAPASWTASVVRRT